jgi:hypothetical protein
VNFDQLVSYCDEIEGKGFYPVVGLWLFNFETISEGGLRTFLSHWSYHLGQNRVIFKPCWEFNQLGDWWGHNPGFNRSWHIAPEDYNRVMGMIRRVRDELGIRNILIASHANIYDESLYSVYGDQLYLPWLEGMRQADIVGASAYDDNVTESWSYAEHLYTLIGRSEMPFIFFEYATKCFWPPYTDVTSDFVRASYSMIPRHPFVKGIIWWFGSHYQHEAIVAIGESASQYDAHGT